MSDDDTGDYDELENIVEQYNEDFHVDSNHTNSEEDEVETTQEHQVIKQVSYNK